MGDQMNGRGVNLSADTEKKTITWVWLKPESNLVFSTKQHSKQRVIYYSQKNITNLDYHRRDK
ncbi:hypothetical protein NQ095_19350 [Rossellomorea sp. SC111]|uniref:hypothetical protein n=1 Tax=Rossellomorea sp. SC111 TaxID=2968985 RepID=UPI00215A4AE6|nr:hypothetical protein [Rossellomorea sp. SC111]MCR8850581.1 hypothetical protein [Rossellomorea sp. SC111]